MTSVEPWRKFRAATSDIAVPGIADRWFAVQVKPRHDKMAAELLEQRGIRSFLPLYISNRRWSDRMKAVELPLFPGYVFAQLDPARRTPLLSTPGVVRLVGVGANPVSIDEGELAAIESAVNSGAHCEPVTRVEIGDRVRVISGPLRGQEGVLVKFRNKNKLVLSVTLVERSIAVEIAGDWLLEPVPSYGNKTSCQASAGRCRQKGNL